MGFSRESHCTEHDAGNGSLPCPWPGCSQGVAGDSCSFGRVTYVRARNVTDGATWWTWRMLPPRHATSDDQVARKS